MSKTRLVIGILLIIFNFVLGKISLPLLAIDLDIFLLIYLISWLLLIVGLLMCGKEGWHIAKKIIKESEDRILSGKKNRD
jgi:hypothetical protein